MKELMKMKHFTSKIIIKWKIEIFPILHLVSKACALRAALHSPQPRKKYQTAERRETYKTNLKFFGKILLVKDLSIKQNKKSFKMYSLFQTSFSLKPD